MTKKLTFILLLLVVGSSLSLPTTIKVGAEVNDMLIRYGVIHFVKGKEILSMDLSGTLNTSVSTTAYSTAISGEWNNNKILHFGHNGNISIWTEDHQAGNDVNTPTTDPLKHSLTYDKSLTIYDNQALFVAYDEAYISAIKHYLVSGLYSEKFLLWSPEDGAIDTIFTKKL